MVEEEKMPFDNVLEAIFNRERLPLHLLYRLSDITVADYEMFRERWTAVPAGRRRAIMRHLADLTEENYLLDFLPIFRDALLDTVAAVRVAALDGLWDATDTRLITPIIRLLQTDESEEVRAAAAAALSHYVLLAEWEQIPFPFSTPIVKALLSEYEKPETAVPIKRATLEALGAANHPRVAVLITEAYESDIEEMRISAVFAMGASADRRWLSTVLAEMENPNAQMRVEAARAASSLGSSDAIAPLERLSEDDDVEVQLAAVEALGHIGGDAAQEILLRLAEETEDEELQEAIAEALDEMALFAGEFHLLDFEDDEEVE